LAAKIASVTRALFVLKLSLFPAKNVFQPLNGERGEREYLRLKLEGNGEKKTEKIVLTKLERKLVFRYCKF
jgi:hypothetical protein